MYVIASSRYSHWRRHCHKCVKNGDCLVGKIANYYDPSDSINSVDVLWFRSKEDQERELKEVRTRDQAVHQVRERSKNLRRETKSLPQKREASEDQKTDKSSISEKKDEKANKSRGCVKTPARCE